MLLAGEKKQLSAIDHELKRLRLLIPNNPSIKYHRLYSDQLRKSIRLFEDVVVRLNRKGMDLSGGEGHRLKSLFSEAIDVLGGIPDPNPVSLKIYQHDLHGPFLGVSDDGGAASKIRKAALTTPKAEILGNPVPIELGVALDAERLAAVGEVAVGPNEYKNVLIESQGSLLKTTNVGTRLNLRYFQQRPIIKIETGNVEKGYNQAIDKASTVIEPFWKTPNGAPKKLIVFFHFTKRVDFIRRKKILKLIRKQFNSGKICDPAVHMPGLMFTVSVSKTKTPTAKKNIDLAYEAGIEDVAVQGVPSFESETKISMPGLLNYFSPLQARTILEHANSKRIRLSAKNLVDSGTVARHVWSGLQTARNMGLELGKYGLFPLTMEESGEVASLMQEWFPSWSAAPVFYVDFPSIDGNIVYTEGQIAQGLKGWLDKMAKSRVKIVLIDTADKDKGRKLLQQSTKDTVGILNIQQVRELDQYAKSKGINCLWAGGITPAQAYDFGKLSVFGIYVTTAAASTIPAFGDYLNDPMITSVKSPSFEGVYTVKLLMEAGFIYSRLADQQKAYEAAQIEATVKSFLKRLSDDQVFPAQNDPLIKNLHELVKQGWLFHYEKVDYQPLQN